jgi:hypothetical protein
MEECDLAIVVFACYTVDKYKEQMIAINNTWGKKCQEYPNVRLLYFLGEEKRDYPEFHDTPVTKYINLPGVKNDYLSASYKQWFGMKYVYENYKPKFIHCIGTDTYINIPKMLIYLNQFNPNVMLYLGGHGCRRKIGERTYYFHSGGPGFVITYDVLKSFYPILPRIMDYWLNICRKENVEYLNPACDVCVAYYLQQPGSPVTAVKADKEFISCNHRGWPCHLNNTNMSNIVVCHLMNPPECIEFTQILEANNYFI